MMDRDGMIDNPGPLHRYRGLAGAIPGMVLANMGAEMIWRRLIRP